MTVRESIAAHLPLRTRRVVGAYGEQSEMTIGCPRRAASVSAGQCRGCCDYDGVSFGTRGAYLTCSHPAAASEADVLRRPSVRSAADRTPLSQVMTGDVLCVLGDLPAAALAELLGRHAIGGVPVVDGAGWPIGVVSRSDLLAGTSPGATVADIMMPVAFSLPESASLSQAAALMAVECVHRIPVVSASGQVVGIVSTLDVTRWLAWHDGYIASR